jgi:hypothetical protein
MIEACIQKVVLFIYRMDPQALCWCAVFGVLTFCALCRKYADSRWLRPLIGLVLAAWFGAVLWMTVLSRTPGGTYEAHRIPLHSYRAYFSGQHPEILRSCFMNVALFYPAGLLFGSLLPKKWSFPRGMLWSVLVFGLFSMTVELCQYRFGLGISEIDDVLHNTLGAALGFAAARLDLGGIADILTEKYP